MRELRANSSASARWCRNLRAFRCLIRSVRKRLILRCNGRYSCCPAAEEVLAFQHRLLNSGVVDAR